jgi:DNA-binding Xre family transcriptional regulator
MDFVDKIDQLLIEKNLKREVLAEYIGVTPSVFSMWKKRGIILRLI